MRQVNLYEAKTQLSRLVQAALDGEEVVIARAGKPAVRLVPVTAPGPKTTGLGTLPVDPEILDGAFSPETDAAIARLFENERTGG
jgi:prevent-host-death family protein